MNRRSVPAHAGELKASNPLRLLLAVLGMAVAAALCAGAGLSAASAWADDSSSQVEGKVTLQIVHGLDFSGNAQVVVNKSYDYYKDATVEDLLAAAKEAGDIKDFALGSNGFLQSVTKADGTVVANAADFSTYWSQYENGTYYSGTDTLKTEKLVADTSYQFAWGSYPTAVAPTEFPSASGVVSNTQAGTCTPPTKVSAVLQIVHGLGFDGSPTVVVNKTYELDEGSVLEDLLKAAVAAGDIKAYALNDYGFLQSFTKADGTVVANTADFKLYWSQYENGSYYSGSDTVATEKVADGTYYQFAWSSYPTAVAPTTWPAKGAESATQAGSGDAAGKATLQVVYGLDFSGAADVKANKTYAFAKDATFKDLLDAAVKAGDIKAYALNDFGYLQSITLSDGTVVANSSDFSLYWSQYENGSYYAGSDTVATEKLANGTIYQLAWNSYPTAAAPTWSALAAPAAASETASGCDTAGTATLQIIHGLGFDGSANVVVNTGYVFVADATVEDLLKAAVAAGDIKAYALNDYGFLQSVTKADGTVVAGKADSSLYWSYYVDGAYYAGSDTLATEKLASGKVYQMVWNSYPTATAPDWTTLSEAGSGTTTAGSATKDAGKDNEAKAIPAADICKVYNGVKTLYTNADTADWSYNPEWKAVDLAATGNASSVDTSAVYAAAVEAFNTPDATNLQRSILAVTALGGDATALEVDGTSYNLVGKMFDNGGSFGSIYAKAFALLALESGSYAVPDGSVTKDSLIADLIASQDSGGNYAASGYTSPDTTAMIVAALAPYASSNSGVAASIEKAVAALRVAQNADGGFGSSATMGSTATNANSTAMVVVAMSALGLDPATQWATASGATPLSALVGLANSAGDGFTYDGTEGAPASTLALATEQGYRALAAYYGYKDSGAAFNVYTQAKDGKECTDCANKQDDPDPTPEPTPTPTPTPVVAKQNTPTQTISNNKIMSRTSPFSFTISQLVPSDATTLLITDKLDDRLECQSVVVAVDGETIEAKVTVNGQNVSISVEDASKYRGKTLTAQINVKVKDSAVLSDASGIASIPNTGYVSVNGRTALATNTMSAKIRVSNATTASTTRTSTSATRTTSTTAKTADGAPLAALALLLCVSGAAAAVARRKEEVR